MFKFGVAVVKGPLDVVPMTRLKVDEGSTALRLHVVVDALSCTSVGAEEDISRLEAFTSFAGEGKTALSLDDLQEPISLFKAEGGASGEGGSEGTQATGGIIVTMAKPKNLQRMRVGVSNE